ncbi:phosphatase [Synergistales bacterium]|nr:phosphatase [Synergistales bacterium]
MPVKAVIDIGTNSTKLIVADADGSVLADRSEITRLGEGVSLNGRLSSLAMRRTSETIADMAGIARTLGCNEVIAVATQAVRAAVNAGDFVDMVGADTELEVKVISGDEEANLSFLAVVSLFSDTLNDKKLTVFDVGGGSSEVVAGRPSERAASRSFPIGALSLHNEIFAGCDPACPVHSDIIGAAFRKVADIFNEKERGYGHGDAITVGVGGTITALAAVKLLADKKNTRKAVMCELTLDDITEQIELYSSLPIEGRKKIKGLNPKRADIILAGACVVLGLLKFTGFRALLAVDRGLRYGVMEKYFGIKI